MADYDDTGIASNTILLELVIQDDLTDLQLFHVLAQGHIVNPQ